MERNDIFNEINRVIDGKITNIEAVFEAIERQFGDIAIIAVDKRKDTVFWGFEYLDEQEEIRDGGE